MPTAQQRTIGQQYLNINLLTAAEADILEAIVTGDTVNVVIADEPAAAIVHGTGAVSFEAGPATFAGVGGTSHSGRARCCPGVFIRATGVSAVAVGLRGRG